MKVPEGYVAFVEELPGANTQAATLAEARSNLQEAVAMVLDANRELAEQSIAGADVIPETLNPSRNVKRADLIRHSERSGCEFHRKGANHTPYLNRHVR